MTIKVQLKREVNGVMQQVNPITSDDCVNLQNGKKLSEFVSSIENDEFSPTITQMSSVSKVGVGEDIDISDNTQEGYLKSAILKGNTLVNLQPKAQRESWGVKIEGDIPQNNAYGGFSEVLSKLKPSTKYLIKFSKNISDKYGNAFFAQATVMAGKIIDDYRIITTLDNLTKDITSIHIYPKENAFSTVKEMHDYLSDLHIMVIEYQEGMENWDIPYFEGMQSVKMPVLTTTTSQNLSSVPFSFFEKTTDRKYGAWTIFEFDNLFSGKIILNKRPFNTIMYFDTKENRLNIGTTVVKDVQLIGFYNPSTNIENNNKGNLLELLESGELDISLQENGKTNVYSYKKNDKTNILTVNEDVTLRGIGDARDTLDCLTGEVTQRIASKTLYGGDNEDWRLFKNTIVEKTETVDFYLINNEQKPSSNIKSDTFKEQNEKSAYQLDEEGVSCKGGSGINIWLSLSNTKATTVAELRAYLQSNPINVQYELANESIKTVDLTPGGTNPTTKPYVWKDGHIQLSSEEGSLLPTLDYSVTTSRGGQILENTKHIAKQDKRIYDLEMLMINSSVEDAYQRLLLQNDVQVMSRMDETHLNPMRYYMLTRLIEEKMYEETDMLNKLDTFFLYGDISSDQYFELMDKIFGMEEIIEEDFTEEK